MLVLHQAGGCRLESGLHRTLGLFHRYFVGQKCLKNNDRYRVYFNTS